MSENVVKSDDRVKIDGELSPVVGVIKIDERQVQDHLGELVRQPDGPRAFGFILPPMVS